MRLPLAALAVLLLAGCISPSPSATPGTQEAQHAVAHAFGAIVKVGSDGFEPVTRVGPDGTVYIAALQYVWVSHDNGTTFHSVPATGGLPIYASDSALAVSPTGQAYITFDWPYAGHTAVCTSTDRGESWSCVPIAVPGATDRMWILAPTPEDAYLITGQTLDRPTFAATHDAGKTWAITSFDPQTSSQGSDLAWDPVHHLVLEGASTSGDWGVRSWDPSGKFLGTKEMRLRTPEPVMAVDAEGTWWAVACANDTGPCGLAAARSTDEGATWTRFPLRTQHNVELPFVTVGRDGRVALAWYESAGTDASDAANQWRVVVAQTSDGGASWSQAVVSGEKPVHTGAMCSSVSCLGEDRFAGDFLGLAYGPDSTLHATWMRQVGSKGVPTSQVKLQDWDDVEYAHTG